MHGSKIPPPSFLLIYYGFLNKKKNYGKVAIFFFFSYWYEGDYVDDFLGNKIQSPLRGDRVPKNGCFLEKVQRAFDPPTPLPIFGFFIGFFSLKFVNMR